MPNWNSPLRRGMVVYTKEGLVALCLADPTPSRSRSGYVVPVKILDSGQSNYKGIRNFSHRDPTHFGRDLTFTALEYDLPPHPRRGIFQEENEMNPTEVAMRGYQEAIESGEIPEEEIRKLVEQTRRDMVNSARMERQGQSMPKLFCPNAGTTCPDLPVPFRTNMETCPKCGTTLQPWENSEIDD